MAYCPVYKNPQVKDEFNSIVEDYGGKPLSDMEFRSKTLRAERFGKDKFAMNAAYYMWNKHQGDMEQIFADKEGAKYRLSKPTEVYEQVEDLDLSLDHLTDAERSYLEAEATVYDPFADEDRGYDTEGLVERTMFTEDNVTKEKYKLPTKKYSNIEKGIDTLFEYKPELLKIGSKEAYSKYLNTIFPNTLNTNILYHIGGKNITKFDSSMFGKGEGTNASGKGVYFQEDVYEIMNGGIGSDYFYESPNPVLSMLQDGVLTMAVANVVGSDSYNETLSVPQEVVIRDVDRILILGSKQDIEGFKEFVTQPTTQSVKPGVSELFNENPELANAVYSAMGLNTINGSEITYTDEEGNPCAKMGLTNTVKGTDWKIVKDFKGKPKHSNGGVDITISDKGVIMRRGGKDIKAKHGLLITNNN